MNTKYSQVVVNVDVQKITQFSICKWARLTQVYHNLGICIPSPELLAAPPAHLPNPISTFICRPLTHFHLVGHLVVHLVGHLVVHSSWPLCAALLGHLWGHLLVHFGCQPICTSIPSPVRAGFPVGSGPCQGRVSGGFRARVVAAAARSRPRTATQTVSYRQPTWPRKGPLGAA